MRLPFSDKFLLDLCDLLLKADELSDEIFLFPSKKLRSLKYSVELDRLKRRYEREKAKTNFSQFIYYLKTKGYIKIKNLEGKKGVLLTKKGTSKALKAKFKTKEKKKRKDGRWQMVIFDIPENKRNLRDLLRECLQFLGYQMLQQSVWVCPYDVFEETEGIIRRYSLDPYVKLFLIEEIEI